VRIVLYTGKGGVGKTTTAAATAAWAAACGRRTLVVSADAAHSLGDVLGCRVGPEPLQVAPNLDALEVDARVEAERHWGTIRSYLVQLFRHQGIEEMVADELALLPGAEEVTTLLAVRHHAEAGAYDLVVVDLAPTGSTLRLLTIPEVARSALRWLLWIQRAVATTVVPLARVVAPVPLPGGEVFRDAEHLLYDKLQGLRELLARPETTLRMVVNPERMVIDEALRAHTDLALFDLACDAVVMNRLLPDDAAEEDFFRDWVRHQGERLQEVEEAFAPLPVLRAPLQPDEVIGVPELARHGETLFAGLEPDAILCDAPRLQFLAGDDGAVEARVPLPHARAEDLSVVKIEAELVVGSGTRRRSIPLPRHTASHELVSARLEDGMLRVGLAPAAASGPGTAASGPGTAASGPGAAAETPGVG
jgi:arsenite-transporting ATPase